MIAIYQGDDTAANMRSVRFKFPDIDVGDGWSIGLKFHGANRSGRYSRGGHLDFNYSREETAAFPLGISYATIYIEKDGLMETVSNSLPILVTDSVERARKGTNDVNLSVVINTNVPHVDKSELTKASSNAEIKELANALLEAINANAVR